MRATLNPCIEPRYFDGSVDPEPFSHGYVETLNPVDDECWTIIQGIIEQNLWNVSKKQQELANLYLERAKLFYTKYKEIHNDVSSSLFAYYFSMNLAKTFLVLRDQKYCNGTFNHGISFSPSRRLQVTLSANNRSHPIFNDLYQLLKPNTLIGTPSINIKHLACQVSELAFQMTNYKLDFRIMRFSYMIAVNQTLNEAWSVIRIRGEILNIITQDSEILNSFNSFFDEISLSARQRVDLFGGTGFESTKYRYFQLKTEFVKNLNDPLMGYKIEHMIKSAFKGYIETNIFDRDSDFDYFRPFNKKNNLKFNELFSSYALVFWCSSVLRYDPSIQLLGSKIGLNRKIYVEANRVCPNLILRHFTSLFTRVDLEFITRN